MSIALKSIELSNIRSHKHVVFEPAETGITAISGPTGAGKSTIVDSLSWALFGTKPNGVTKTSAIFRSDAVFGEDKCYAIVQIYVEGVLLKVERKMVAKGGAVECDVYEWREEDDDWKHVAGSSVSHSEPYIRSRLKMDEKGFLTAILVQQKQVDQLISATPRERATTIEQLTGISSITAGLISARQDYNTLRKTAQLSSVDPQEFENSKEAKLKAESDLQIALESFREESAKMDELAVEGKKLRSEVDSATEAATELAEATEKKIKLIAETESLDSQLERIQSEKARLKTAVSSKAKGVSFEDSEARVKQLRSALSSDRHRVEVDSNSLRTARETVATAKASLASSEHKNKKSIESAISKAETELSEAREKLRKMNLKTASDESEVAQLTHAIEVVGAGECPTCLQGVKDTHSAVDALEKRKMKLESAIAKRQEKHGEIDELIASTSSNLSSLEDLRQIAVSAAEAASKIESLESSITAAEASIKAGEVELASAEKMHNAIVRDRDNAEAYQSAVDHGIAIAKRQQEIGTELKALESRITGAGGVSPAKLKKMREKLYAMQDTAGKTRTRVQQFKSDGQLLQKEIEHLGMDIDRMARDITKYNDLLASVEIAATSVQILDEFRGARMKTALPAIETYASELLSRFTDGKFSGLVLDEKFNASVMLADGTTRSVGLLSGGELSSASIALRLSVSMLLNSGGPQNMIILDEVLVSQDVDRSELILSTIKDVCQGQVIMIAHNGGIQEIADKTVELASSSD